MTVKCLVLFAQRESGSARDEAVRYIRRSGKRCDGDRMAWQGQWPWSQRPTIAYLQNSFCYSFCQLFLC